MVAYTLLFALSLTLHPVIVLPAIVIGWWSPSWKVWLPLCLVHAILLGWLYIGDVLFPGSWIAALVLSIVWCGVTASIRAFFRLDPA